MTLPWSRVALALCGIVAAVTAGMLTAVFTAERVSLDFAVEQSAPIVAVAPQEFAAHTE